MKDDSQVEGPVEQPESDSAGPKRDESAPFESEESEELELIAEEVKKFLPDEVNSEQIAHIALKVARKYEAYRGPVPNGEMLEGLKRVDPTFPDRALRFAEAEQKFRHSAQNRQLDQADKELEYHYSARRFGQVLAFVIILTVIGAAVWLIKSDKNVGEFAPIIYALAALAGIIITAKTAENVAARKSGSQKDEEN